jgi:hypothetical protein
MRAWLFVWDCAGFIVDQMTRAIWWTLVFPLAFPIAAAINKWTLGASLRQSWRHWVSLSHEVIPKRSLREAAKR